MSKGIYTYFHGYLFHNLGLKLVSLALALGLWLAVANEPVAEVAVDVPIALRNLPPNLQISSEDIPKAQIRLRGPERAIRRLDRSQLYLDLWLNDLRAGERSFDLTAREVHQPSELQVVEVIPSAVQLAFDVRASREVPVEPRVIGSPPAGYRAQIAVEPSRVLITGPKRRVEAVESVTTDPVDVTGAMNPLTAVRHAYVADPLVQLANPHPVRITIMIDKGVSANGR